LRIELFAAAKNNKNYKINVLFVRKVPSKKWENLTMHGEKEMNDIGIVYNE